MADWHVAQLLDLLTRMDLSPGPGGSRITPASVALKAAIHRGEFASAVVHVVALYPSSQLVAHSDPPVTGTRYHVPLVVNNGCWSFHDGTWQQLEVGTVYEMDPTKLHGAVNWGTEVRLHLIVDVA
jgi:hypothetical protein